MHGSVDTGASPSGGVPAAGTYFLGRYRVVDEIGIGGMASVHLARMDGPGGFQKWVAIKRIHPHLIEDESFIQMFLDEARVAARISHPNVATVFELGKHEDTYWIAMEYLHGEPLREVMRRTEELGAPMPPEIACRVIADAAEGLNAAHELLGKNGEKLNLIHRDVTPHNLFVTYDGTTKVVDFGIAKFSSRMSSTRAGTLKGKLAYMSPEQVQGEPIDRRTDIFALGVVLWELTTGQRLFRMDSDLDTLAKVQECNIPRPTTIVRGYPIDLEKIVMKALSKNRGERFKTAREFSRALQSLLMRRGLFIASDEVAGYVQSIFADRIQKREAHLRWAGDVTQTINVEGMLAPEGMPRPQLEPSIRSYSSEVQASSPQTARVAPRPAAGAPPPTMSYFASSEGNPAGATDKPVRQAIPVGPPLGPKGPFSPMSAPQATPRMAVPGPGLGQTLQSSNVPRPNSAEYDDAPTIQATPEQRAAMGYGTGGDFDDDYDDNEDTIVSPAPVAEPYSERGAPAPLPAAGRPAMGAPAAQVPYGSPGSARSVGGPFLGGPRTLPIGTQSPIRPNAPVQGGFGGQTPGPNPPGPNPVNPFAQTVPPNFHISDPSLPDTRIGARDDFFAGPPNMPPPGYGATAAMQAAPPVAPRLFAPPQMEPTQPAQTLKRPGVPMWAVAVGSGLAALFVAGLLFFVLTRATTPTRKSPATARSGATAASTGLATAPATHPTAATPTVMVAPAGSAGGGLFTPVRSAFLGTLVPAPSGMGGSGATGTPAPTDDPGPSPADAPKAAANEGAAATTTTAISAPTSVATPTAQPLPPPTAIATALPRRIPTPAPATGDNSGASAATGLLSVICIPGCDEVYDNGKPLGQAPIVKRQVSVGSHRLKLVSVNPPATKVVPTIVLADQLATVRQSMP
jgi:serine/threonine protein kinase